MRKINKKIPGDLPPPPKAEIDGKIVDLSSKTLPELLELRDRQQKLLNNKSFVSKLPDKGEKIKAFHDKLVSELKSKQEEEQTCQMLDKLNLRELDKETIQNVEWEGKLQKKTEACLDSDDDSEPEDVMHILSKSTDLEKKVKILQPDKPLVTAEDLINIGEIPHVKYLVEKTETAKTKTKATGQFKPYKTTTSDVHNPEKELNRVEALSKKHKNWEVTAATSLPILHGPAKVLNLEESLKLQMEHNKHLRDIEAKNAAMKLQNRMGIKMAVLPDDTSKFGTYRDIDSDDSEASDPEGSDKEVHDEEPERGGVVFTVMK